MRKLPDLSDEAAMVSRGRRGAIISARNEAAEALRDCVTAIQSADVFNDDVSAICQAGRDALDRLVEIHALAQEWCR